MPGSSRALGISGWLVAAALSIIFLMARYDVKIQERAPGLVAAVHAAAIDVGQGETKPVAEERYSDLAAGLAITAGADLLAVDRRLRAAEREFPSDYRFSYERATLAVYGRAEHHEAFHYLRRAADKAIGTQRAGEMLDRLEKDGRAGGRLRRLTVGHEEWSLLHKALENRDRDRLWREHASRRVTPPPGHRTPCKEAWVAFRRGPTDPGSRSRVRRLRKVCLRDGAVH